jgi:RNA polymerase sigma-70 factor (ECF subfamily)
VFFETFGAITEYKEWFQQREREHPLMHEDDIRERLRGRHYEEAFSLLLERCKDKVFRLAWSILRNETQAEDAAQDVFVKVWKGLPGYDGAASLSTWIYVIARNTCFSELKRRATHAAVSLDDPALEGACDGIASLQFTDPAPGADMDVEAMLAQLPEKYRQVIVLFYLEQKQYQEVSDALGLPLGTVKTLLFRARKELLRISRRPAVPDARPLTGAERPTNLILL